MGKPMIQPSFTSGELAPSLYGRVDFARYYTGVRTCLNFIVRQFGGVTNRPGTRFVCHEPARTAGSNDKVRLIPFEFSTSQAYALLFGHRYMRIIKDGGLVVHPNTGAVIEVVTIYDGADLSLLKFTQSADVMTITHPDYPPQQLSRTDHHVWSFSSYPNVEGPFQDINVDTSKTIYANGYSGNITITAASAIFTQDMVGQMLYIEQSPDGTTRKWEVGKDVVLNDIRRAGDSYYQAIDSGNTGTVRPSTLEGIENDGDPGVTWQYLHSGFGIVRITGYTSATVLTGTVLKRLPESVVTGNLSRTITNVEAGTEGSIEPPIDPVNAVVTCPAHGFSSGDSVTISGVTGMTGINVTAQIIVNDSNNFQLSGVVGSGEYVSGGTAIKTLNGTNTYKWAFEAWGGDQGYPAATAYTQQRQLFGGAPGSPQSMDMSRTAGFTDFGISNPILDDDAIRFTINSRRANEIRHFVELSELIALTSDGPFLIRGGGNDGVFAPGKVVTKRQGSSGSSHVPPVIVDNHALYIQEKGNQVRSLGYSFENDAFIGNDLTVISGHLFQGREIREWTYQAIPFSCVWAVRDDGVLLGFTYMPEHEVAGWHRHVTDGSFESICCIPEGNEDVVYLTVRRTVENEERLYVERLSTRLFSSADDFFFVDSGLSYSGEPATTFSGLDHLEGKTVAVLADGHVHPPCTVEDGSITLQYEASKVHAGLPYISDFETLDLANSQADLRERKKIINHVNLMVEETRGILAGPDGAHLTEFKPRSTEPFGAPPSTITGLVDIRVQATWDKYGRVFIRQSDPLPITILAVSPEVTTGGT